MKCIFLCSGDFRKLFPANVAKNYGQVFDKCLGRLCQLTKALVDMHLKEAQKGIDFTELVNCVASQTYPLTVDKGLV